MDICINFLKKTSLSQGCTLTGSEKVSQLLPFSAISIALSILLSASLPSKAEESNIFDSVLSFFSSGDNQGPDCADEDLSEEIAEKLRSEVCPHFLMEQIANRDSKKMFFGLSDVSADNQCKNFYSDKSFKNTQELENYLKDKKPFSEINTVPVADCLSHPFPVAGLLTSSEEALPEDKHKQALAEYYLSQQRLESGMSRTLQDIAAIDQLIGNSPLKEINCKKFQLTLNTFTECQSLQKCSSSEELIEQSAQETIKAVKAIQAIDQRIKDLKGPRNRYANKNKEKIQELKERKAVFQSLYPWTVGRIFQKGYEENSSVEQTAQLIKDQMSYTRGKLKENIHEMQEAVSCIRYSRNCDDVEFDKVMSKTPNLDTEQIFQINKIKSMSDSETASLPEIQRKKTKEHLTAKSYFDGVQCRQKLREDVSSANKELGFFALDVGLTVATVGLGSAAVMGRLAIRAGGQISKAQRLQNLGLMGVDISFSAPYINKAINDCDHYMNQLEQKAVRPANNICTELPVRSKITSDLKSCLLTASLASLPLAVPAFAVAGRAIVKKMSKSKPTAPPSTPKDPTTPPPSNPPNTPPARQLSHQSTTNSSPSSAPSTNIVQRAETPPSTNLAQRAETSSTGRKAVVKEKNTSGNYKSGNAETPETLLLSDQRRNARPTASAQNNKSKTSSNNAKERQPRTSARKNTNTKRPENSKKEQSQTSARNNQRFHSLKDSENRAGKLSRRIASIIKENQIIKKNTHKNPIGNLIAQARNHLRQQNPRLNDKEISQIIAKDLKQQGVDVKFTDGVFKIGNKEGVFVINSDGRARKILNTKTAAGSSARKKSTETGRAGAVVLRANNGKNTSRMKRRTAVNTGRAVGQRKIPRQAITAAPRAARSMHSSRPTHSSRTQPDRLLPGSIRAGVAGKNSIAAGAAASSTSFADENAKEESSSPNSSDANQAGNSGRNTADNSRSRDNDRMDDNDKNKKADLDCSKYKGSAPQNRREMICYYYMRAEQLRAETQSIQQNTQALNQFKSQVWNGVKENQVPPSFFTNIQKNIQKNKSADVDYLSSFRLMYDISRIQNERLTAHDKNRLMQIIQNTDQYMRSQDLDGYSHIRESVNILLNRMNIPAQRNQLRL